MEDFKRYLLKEYGDSVKEISKTQQKYINDISFHMIDFDKIAKDYSNYGTYASADALNIIKEDDRFIFQFIEFKNIDFSSKEDREMSKVWLEDILNQMGECEHGCFILKEKGNMSQYLIDKSKMMFRLKPIETLSVFYFIFNKYFKGSVEDTKSAVLGIEKQYWIVSKTNYEINFPLMVNESNYRRNRYKEPFSFLFRYVPYYYDKIVALNFRTFKKYIDSIEDDFIDENS